MSLVRSVWPLFDLAVETPVLRLEYATDAHLERLADFRDGRVIQKGEEPFDGDSSFYEEELPRARWKSVLGEWGARSRTSPQWWHLSFAVLAEGRLVGQQNITADNFPVLRTVNSFSYVDRRRRGEGIGKEMRAAALHLAFAGLGALRAESDAFSDNLASAAISRSLGYVPNGTLLAPRPSGHALMNRHLLTRERWEELRRHDIHVRGLAECLPVLGLEEPS